MKNIIHIGDITVGDGQPFILIAGPCVIENAETTFSIASFLKNLTRDLDIPFLFKSSYDKANRTSIDSFRGPGISKGLNILKEIKDRLHIQILSDVHRISEIDQAVQVLDVIQVPAFLCRQTDFLLEIARTGKPVNIKKGPFMAPWDMANVVEKVTSTGNHQILLTERGTMFGYNNLTVDFRGIKIMQDIGFPVIFDITHSIQLPGGSGTSSGGQRKFAPLLAKAGIAAGANGIFMEVHLDPANALCDGPNSLRLEALSEMLIRLKAINSAANMQEDSQG